MLSETFCRDQLMRLSGTPHFDKLTGRTLSDMVDVLKESASERICDEAVSNLQRDLDMRPTVADIRRAIDALNYVPYGNFCDRCRDSKPSGWLYQKRLIKGKPYEFRGRCKCQPGGWV